MAVVSTGVGPPEVAAAVVAVVTIVTLPPELVTEVVAVVGGEQFNNCEAGAGGIAGLESCCSRELTSPKEGALNPGTLLEPIDGDAVEFEGLLEFCNNCFNSTCWESSDLGTVEVTVDDLHPLVLTEFSPPAPELVDDDTIPLSISVPSTGSVFTLDNSRLSLLFP